MSEIFDRFDQLESNNNEVVEAVKKRILDQLNIVKDPWLINGLYDYYLSTNSAKTIVILVNIREPHYQYLFDRLSDSINNTTNKSSTKNDHHKVQALTLLGHIVRGQPTWLYKLSEHQLLKDLLKLLKCEVEILPLISALLVLIILIPMIPYTMGEVLNDIFEIFSRLASWNCSPGGRLIDDELVHMQVALYALFLRLYGMFPCNFLFYLRSQYKDKNRPVFIHTIKPMLETVKMNSSLVTTSRDNETTNERWKKMEVHDVIVECERFSLDLSDNHCAHDTCGSGSSDFRSRSGTLTSTAAAGAATTTTTIANNKETTIYLQTLKTLASSMVLSSSSVTTNNNERNDYFNPIVYNLKNDTKKPTTTTTTTEFHHDDNVVPEAGSSPPEAAIEATPETAPQIKTNTINEELRNGGVDEQEELTMKQSDNVLQESEDSTTSDNLDEDRSSPCSIGGLHMPNSKSMRNFTRRVQRLRHRSQCTADECNQELFSYLESNAIGIIVRRVNSCPEIEKGPGVVVLDETDDDDNDNEEEEKEEKVEMIKEDRLKDCETQTYNFWPMPYEHLFLGIFPSLGMNNCGSSGSNNEGNSTTLFESSSSSPSNLSVQPSSSIYEILDKYVDNVVKSKAGGNDNHHKENIKLLKSQLELLHQQLLFERHRREIHAFKNRRFLAESKTSQVLEEHNSALRDQVQLQQSDIDSLKMQLENIVRECELEKRHSDQTIRNLEEKIQELELKNKQTSESDKDICKEYEDLEKNYSTLTQQKQLTESRLIEALAEMKIAKEQALIGDRGLAELEFVNKQLLMMGELQLKYKERLDDLDSLRRTDEELNFLKESYSNEIKILHQRLQEKTIKLEAFTNRIEQLEQIVLQKEEAIALQKRSLNSINEEIEEKVKVVQEKYQTQLIICRTMEEKILELYRQIELISRKPIRSPDTSSCQEAAGGGSGSVGVGIISGKSSPLSYSFASSSEGSNSFAAAAASSHYSKTTTTTDSNTITLLDDHQTLNNKNNN